MKIEINTPNKRGVVTFDELPTPCLFWSKENEHDGLMMKVCGGRKLYISVLKPDRTWELGTEVECIKAPKGTSVTFTQE